MFVHIQLLDAEDHVYCSKKFNVESDMTINELQTKIKSRIFCPIVNQVLTHQNGDLIDVNDVKTLKEASIFPEETLTLKHSDLSLWTTYRKLLLEKNFPREEDIREKTKEIFRIDKIMDKSLFFLTYLHYSRFRDKHFEKYSYFVSTKRLMKTSAAMYFKSLYSPVENHIPGSRRLKCRFKRIPESMSGSHDNIFAILYGPNANERRKFVLKTHCFGRSTLLRRGNKEGVDIMEVFVLKALQTMNLGPEVHFIPLKLPDDSKEFRSMYVASEFRPDFCRLSDIKDIDPEVAFQLLLITEIFFLKDVHLDNCGSWANTSTVAIVDFNIDENDYRDIFSSIQKSYPSYDWKDQFDQVLRRPDPGLYRKIEHYLKLWDIDNVITKTLKETKAVKSMLEKHKTTFRSRDPTYVLNDFAHEIRKSLKRLYKKLKKCVI